MNYQNIENEIKKYSEFFKLSQNSISKLTTYYKEVGKGGTKFIDKIKQYLDEFYYEVLTYVNGDYNTKSNKPIKVDRNNINKQYISLKLENN